MESSESVDPANQISSEHNYYSSSYKPLYLQRIDKALGLEHMLKATQHSIEELEKSDDDDLDLKEKKFLRCYQPNKTTKGDKIKSNDGVSTSTQERKQIRQSVYCTSHLKYKKKWLRDLLLSDSDMSEDDTDDPITEKRLHSMLREHIKLKQYRDAYPTIANEYKDYTLGVLGQGSVLPDPVAAPPSKKKSKVKPAPVSSITYNEDELEDGEIVLPYGYTDLEQFYSGKESPLPSSSTPSGKAKGKKPPSAEVLLAKRKKIWHHIVKKDIPKASKARVNLKKEQVSNAKKCAMAIMRQKRKDALASQKAASGLQMRMRRICRDVMIYWKRFDKVEKQQLRKVQKEAQEQRKQDLNMLEAKRQTRKLNFLITQTELYAHFMAKKMPGVKQDDTEHILGRLDEKAISTRDRPAHLQNDLLDMDDYDPESTKNKILHNVEAAYDRQLTKTQRFDQSVAKSMDGNMGLSAPQSANEEHPQPSILEGKLKPYQIKGMNWLANLYMQGINGILADEMGLGKTVQSISFLAHLAEVHGIWGPFLVIAPASTLHNWQQECAKFVPKMRVVPYWGTTQERKVHEVKKALIKDIGPVNRVHLTVLILRKFWDRDNLHTEKASFHIVITSYQLIIQDTKYFSKIAWHYMVLDEAQALKSSSSTRWKTLLSFNCRNRLLLTGTPIQNSMAELWALLHFIMPTMFDSHDEFNEWFSKDIENSVENKSAIDESHLSRLHMILKPFMLRRIKKDVENDLSDKIEVLVYCPLTIRQRYLYDAIKRKIRIEDLLQSARATSATAANVTASSLMNLVMQFRKVCNHPELFERRDIKSPAYVPVDAYVLPKLIYREGILTTCLNNRNHIIHRMLSLYVTSHSHKESLSNNRGDDNLFSWLRLMGMNSGELYKAMFCGLLALMQMAFRSLRERQALRRNTTWHEQEDSFACRRRLLLELSPLGASSEGGAMSDLVFTSYTTSASTHLTHRLYHMKETQAHRKIRLKNCPEGSETAPTSPRRRHHPKTPVKTQPMVNGTDANTPTSRELGKYHEEESKLLTTLPMQLTDMPVFLNHMIPKAVSCPLEMFCSDRSARYEEIRRLQCGTRQAKDMLRFGPSPRERHDWYPGTAGGLEAITPYFGFSNVYIPDKRSMIVDAGKMHVLDELLAKLKREGHRVLIYSTMTKVIDLLEEFMWFRKHRYMRLDGSSKISERRDMVDDFQSKTDIFVFLLSTRAGGLGINLTAADTVIFYDSDWNPTVDAQAMDRAHRLGQTKQVTVYRLICKGTIEERILERAREKSEIQRMVISGHNTFKPDVLKPKEVVSLLIDDDSMKKRIQLEQQNKAEKSAPKKRAAADKFKQKSDDNPPKPKRPRGRKPKVTETSTPSCTPPAASPQVAASPPVDESADVDIFDDESSRASSPAVSSCPSTPSILHTPQSSKKKKGGPRGRPKGSRPNKPIAACTGRTKTPKTAAAGLKKALNAAEIAGARAGMSAALAQYGYSVKPRK